MIEVTVLKMDAHIDMLDRIAEIVTMSKKGERFDKIGYALKDAGYSCLSTQVVIDEMEL